jgi:hypothetical protein
MAGGFQHFGFKLNVSNDGRAIKQVERASGNLVSSRKHGGQSPKAYVSDPDGQAIAL